MVLLSVLILLLSAVSVAFSPHIYVYMALESASGMAVGGISVNVFVIGRYTVQDPNAINKHSYIQIQI